MGAIITDIAVTLLLLMAILAQSLRFTAGRLTTFELKRQATQGDPIAAAELELRRERGLLIGLQHLSVLALLSTICAIAVLAYSPSVAILISVSSILLTELMASLKAVRQIAERFSTRYTRQLFTTVRLLKPLLRLTASSHIDPVHTATFYSRDELLHMIEHDRGILNPHEQALIQQALTLRFIKVKDIMQPRSTVVFLQPDEPLGPLLLDKLHKSGQAYFPIAHSNLDKIVGIVAMSDLLPLRQNVRQPTDVMNPTIIYVAEKMPASSLIDAFLQTGQHLFIVIDELEKTTGVITIQAILQQIFGTSHDSFDQYEDRRAVVQAAIAARHRS